MRMDGSRSFTGAAISVALLCSISTATAQYVGPGAQAAAALPTLRTLGDVLAAPVDDQPVEITGVVVRQLGRERFLFRDETGELQLEIDREDFPAGQPIGGDTRVVIIGEVEARHWRTPRIDVDQIRLAPVPSPHISSIHSRG
jgi:uncharacterized protein (TIGR00156 family)